MNDFVPSADATTLMRQAHQTACRYMIEATDAIDASFGEGYAKEHPDLIAAFMKTAAADFHTAILAKAIGGGCEAMDEIAGAIQNGFNLVDSTIEGK